MLKKNKIFTAALALVLSAPISYSQSDVVATGGEASGADGSTSYTVGQLNYHTYTSVNGESVSEGVQQPYEIYSVGMMEITPDAFDLSVFPNPATNYLTLKGKSTIEQELKYTLCDANGKVLETLEIKDDLTTIQMSNYTPATYFLNVTQQGTTIKSFKIIKNH